MTITDETLVCGIDIFASSFFMLSRWEEYLGMNNDGHGRFPGNQSLLGKNNLLHRPVVNEYVEMLWNMLVDLGYKGKRVYKEFQLSLTHDVDALTYSSYRTVLGDLIKRRSPLLAAKNLGYVWGKDPFDTYEYLMG